MVTKNNNHDNTGKRIERTDHHYRVTCLISVLSFSPSLLTVLGHGRVISFGGPTHNTS